MPTIEAQTFDDALADIEQFDRAINDWLLVRGPTEKPAVERRQQVNEARRQLREAAGKLGSVRVLQSAAGNPNVAEALRVINEAEIIFNADDPPRLDDHAHAARIATACRVLAKEAEQQAQVCEGDPHDASRRRFYAAVVDGRLGNADLAAIVGVNPDSCTDAMMAALKGQGKAAPKGRRGKARTWTVEQCKIVGGAEGRSEVVRALRGIFA